MPTKENQIRQCFHAYQVHDRELLESLLTDDFTFTSPYDDHIDKAAYFERCWAGAIKTIESHTLEHIAVIADGAFVTYLALALDGKQFRNTEFFTFAGDKIASVDVYFGASYRDGVFVKS